MSAAKIRHWVCGEFKDSTGMLTATKTLREEGVGELDTHTAYPIHGIDEALGLKRSRVSAFALVGGITGVATAQFLQLYFNWYDYPLNIANKAPLSEPVFVPVTFELMVLLSCLSIVGSLIVYFWKLPQPFHPLFEHEPFVKTASTSGWWVSVNSDDVAVADKAKARLEALGASNIGVIEEDLS